jgi:hypothetical protein
MLLNKDISWFQHSFLKDGHEHMVPFIGAFFHGLIVMYNNYIIHLNFMTFVSYRKTQIKG